MKVNIKVKSGLVIGLAGLVMLTGWVIKSRGGQLSNNNGMRQITVTTSFYPLYFFTREIGGDKVRVINITPAGAEPHDYEPSSGDIVNIENSKLLIINGVVEPWAARIKSNLAGKSIPVLEAGQGLFTQTVTDEQGITGLDPHIWLDPVLAKEIAAKINDKLGLTDPANAAGYEKNTQALAKKLDQLNADYKAGLVNCQTKDIVTSHAAFGYLAKEYGLNQVSIAGLSPDAEPSLQQLGQIADLARKNNIKYIFFESLASPKLAETIANEIGAKTLVLNPLEGLTPEETAAGKNYFTEMEQNLVNLRTALQCQQTTPKI